MLVGFVFVLFFSPQTFLTPVLGTVLYTYFSFLGHLWDVTPAPLKPARGGLPWSLSRPFRAVAAAHPWAVTFE